MRRHRLFFLPFVASCVAACSSSTGGEPSSSDSGSTGHDSGSSGSDSGRLPADSGGSSSSGSSSEGGTNGDGGVNGCGWRASWTSASVSTLFTAAGDAAPSGTLTFTPPTIPCLIFKITDYGAQPASGTGTFTEGTGDAGVSDAAGAEAASSDSAASDATVIDGSRDAGAESDATDGGTAESGAADGASDGAAADGAAADGAAADGGGAGKADGGGADGGGADAGPMVIAPLNTTAFANAVAAAKAAGGGVVDVPPGTWLTGAIHLDSSIELHLEAGATVVFSQNANDYLPAVLTRWEGLDVMNFSPFVYTANAHDVAITGPGAGAASPGILDGQGSSWWSWKSTAATEDQNVYQYYVQLLQADGGLPIPLPTPPVSAKVNGLRPTFVECNACTNFYIDGIQTQNAAYWGIHPLYSTNVIIRNSNLTSNILGSNGDGIDVDSSKNVLIENDSFATSDDIISLKSGLNEDGIAVGRPTEEVVIRNITATQGHALSIGSEMSGGIDNVLVTADTNTTNMLNGMQYLLRIKTKPGRGGTIQNIWFENTTGTNWANYAVEMTTNYPSSTIAPHNTALIPLLKNVTVKNVTGTSTRAPAIDLVGLSTAPFTNVTFDTVQLTGTTPNGCTAIASGVTVVNSTITGVTAPADAGSDASASSGFPITCP